MYHSPADYISTHRQDMENAASALPLLSYLAHTNASLGVHGNLIFNSISNAEIDYYADIAGEFPIANTTINTTATIFHVTCGLIPDAKQNGTSNGLTWNVNTPIQNGTIAGGNTNPPFKLLGEPYHLDCHFGRSHLYLLPAPYAIRMLPLNYGDYYSSVRFRTFFSHIIIQHVSRLLPFCCMHLSTSLIIKATMARLSHLILL